MRTADPCLFGEAREEAKALMHALRWTIKEVTAARTKHRIATKERVSEEVGDMSIDVPFGEENPPL